MFWERRSWGCLEGAETTGGELHLQDQEPWRRYSYWRCRKKQKEQKKIAWLLPPCFPPISMCYDLGRKSKTGLPLKLAKRRSSFHGVCASTYCPARHFLKKKVQSQTKFGNAVKLLQQLEFWGPSSLTRSEALSPGSVQAGSTPSVHTVFEGNPLALVIQMD